MRKRQKNIVEKCKRVLNRHFSEEHIQMTDEHKEDFLNGELQI